jgi:hypothetical protein
VGSGSAARVWPEVTAKSLDEDELVATTGPTNLQVCRHGPRHFAHQPPAAQSLKGISPIAWGCHSAAPATPGHRPPRTTQLGRSCLRNRVGGRTQHRHTGRKRSFLLEGEQEANGRMRLPTRPSTHCVASGMYRSGRARLRASRSAGRALFEHRADGPPVPSKRQAGSVANPGTPPPGAVRQLHKPRSARLPRRQRVGYRGPWPSARRGCRVAVVTGGVVNGRLIGQISNGIVNRWGKTYCGI